MLNTRLLSFLKIHPDETRLAGLVAMLFLCIQAGQGIGENAAFSLFLSSIDVDVLPVMYMGLGVVVFVASIAFSASLSRFQNSSVVINLLAGSAVLFGVEWFAIVLFRQPISYPLLWITTYGMGVVLGTLLWTTAGEVCDARQAKRLFPLFTSLGILGSVLGNLLTGVIASLIGAEGLVLFYAVLLGIGFFLARKITGGYFKFEEDVDVSFSMLNDLRAGYDFVRNSQLFRLIAISSILYSILFFTVDFPFSERISNAYLNDAEGLASFKGLFTSVTTAITFLVSLFLANRLYTRLGIVNNVLIMPITYVVAFAVFFLSFNFWGAVGAKFGQMVVLGGLASTAWNAMFNVVPADRRGQVMAFNNGVPSQIGVVLSGILIILSNRALQVQHVLLFGAVVALVTVFVTLKMRPAYGEALLSALRAGRVEVFSEGLDDFSGYKDNPVTLQIIFKSLKDPSPVTRRLAVEMLTRVGSRLAIPDLIAGLSDEDASVRVEAIKALIKLDAKPAVGMIVRGLDDSSDAVREQTLASLPKLEAASSPDLIQSLERLLEDSNVRVSARAAIVLLYLKETGKAAPFISNLLESKEETMRLAALRAHQAIASGATSELKLDKDLVLKVLTDPVPAVRRNAVKAASLMMDDELLIAVAQRLADEDPIVRENASESLRKAWPASRNVLLQTLGGDSYGAAVSAALDAIPAGDDDILHPLKGYIQHEVAIIRHWRMLINAIPYTGQLVKLLVDILNYHVSSSEERLIKAVGLFGNPRAMELVRKGVVAGDASARAAALETLETLGDKRITNDVLPILDRGGLLQTESDQEITVEDAINVLLDHKEKRLNILALYAIAELKLREFMPLLQTMLHDDDPLMRETARDAMSRMGGTVLMKKTAKNLKTLKTLSVMDRILLLRQVPMFSGLSPDDLERIADIAEEQLFLDQSLLCREGEHGDALYVITSGKVDVITGSGKQETVLATRGVGDFVGEMAILESAPRSATLKARGSVRVLVINGNTFKTILLDRPEVAVSALRQMSKKIRELNKQVDVTNS